VGAGGAIPDRGLVGGGYTRQLGGGGRGIDVEAGAVEVKALVVVARAVEVEAPVVEAGVVEAEVPTWRLG
jgi:hypothetical protein